MADPTDIIAERAGCAPELDSGLAHRVVDGCSEDRLSVRDDLPERPTITTAELDVIETFFADILDMVLNDNSGVPPASLCHNHLP
jgi:hypothetical protein